MSEPSPGESAPVDERTPISFIILLVLAVLYLGWRLVQGIVVALGWLF